MQCDVMGHGMPCTDKARGAVYSPRTTLASCFEDPRRSMSAGQTVTGEVHPSIATRRQRHVFYNL